MKKTLQTRCRITLSGDAGLSFYIVSYKLKLKINKTVLKKRLNKLLASINIQIVIKNETRNTGCITKSLFIETVHNSDISCFKLNVN